jgi:hypothetical protein
MISNVFLCAAIGTRQAAGVVSSFRSIVDDHFEESIILSEWPHPSKGCAEEETLSDPTVITSVSRAFYMGIWDDSYLDDRSSQFFCESEWAVAVSSQT